MLHNEWQFFTNTNLHECLHSNTCRGIKDSLMTLGKIQFCFIIVIQWISGNLEDAKVVSFHPPHLELENGRLLPKALIPFCSYQGIMLGKKIKNWDFVTCDKFRPTLLNGQLCYSLNISQVVPSTESKGNNKNGLLLVLDQPSSLNIVDNQKPTITIHMNTDIHIYTLVPLLVCNMNIVEGL